MTDLWNDPAWKAMASRASDELVGMIHNSAIGMTLAPPTLGEADVKMALEIGMMILLDKPVIVVVQKGRLITERLRRCADRVVEVDLDGDPEGAQKLVGKAVTELIGREGKPAGSTAESRLKRAMQRVALAGREEGSGPHRVILTPEFDYVVKVLAEGHVREELRESIALGVVYGLVAAGAADAELDAIHQRWLVER